MMPRKLTNGVAIGMEEMKIGIGNWHCYTQVQLAGCNHPCHTIEYMLFECRSFKLPLYESFTHKQTGSFLQNGNTMFSAASISFLKKVGATVNSIESEVFRLRNNARPGPSSDIQADENQPKAPFTLLAT